MATGGFLYAPPKRKRSRLGLPLPGQVVTNAPVGLAPGVKLGRGVAVAYDSQGHATGFAQSPFATGVHGSVTYGSDGKPLPGSLAPTGPKPPSVPAGGGGGGGAAGGPGGGELGDDAQAAAARAQALFDRTQRIGQLQQQGAYDAQDLAEALRRMHEQQPKDEQVTKEGANRQGLFYSGTLGKRLGDLTTEYARREGDQQQAYQRRAAARVAAIDALNQGASVDDAGITAALLDRLTAGDVQAAGSSSLAANPDAVPAPAAGKVVTPKAKAAPKPKVIVKRGKVFRLYPGRKPIYLRPATGRG